MMSDTLLCDTPRPLRKIGSKRGALRRAITLAGVLGALPACGEPEPVFAERTSGVTFTFPANDQWDVPTGARLVLAFTDPVNPDAVQAGCGVDGSGPLCVMGENGPIAGVAAIAGERGTVIHFDGALAPGATYQVYARPALLDGTAENLPIENLPEDAPLLTFHTRSTELRSGQAPVILRVDNQDPAAFIAGSGVAPPYPTVDFASIRVLFSEPMDPTRAILGQSVVFARVDDNGGAETPIDGDLLMQGVHLTFDPRADMTPGVRYVLRLSSDLTDMGGEPLDATTFEFTPMDSRTEGVLIEQVFDAQPAEGDPDFPAPDSIAGVVPNAIGVSYPLVGDNTIYIKDGTVASHIANLAAFGGPVPITIRKGQMLATTGLEIALGGVIPAGLSTGDIRVSFISDATGIILPNPYRDDSAVPVDDDAPIFLQLAFDVAVTAEDATGNAVLNQTIMNVQVTGAIVFTDGAMAIEAVGTMELGLLGVARAPSNMVMRLQTNEAAVSLADTTPPALTASFPGPLSASLPPSASFPVTQSVILTFTEPMDTSALATDFLLTRNSDGTAVDVSVMVTGSSVVVTPRAPLDYDELYTIALDDPLNGLGMLTDLAGNAIVWSPDDPTEGTGRIEFSTPTLSPILPAPPLMSALYPGVPCALEGATGESPGRCVGGQPPDTLYRPFVLPAGRAIEGYFNQPMDPTSMVLGSLCDTGSVRVEELDDTGACVAPVSGSLLLGERGFRFVADQPWQPDQAYRLTVVSGPDAICGAGEVCGQNGKALNTDPINGMRGDVDPALDSGGGPDIVIPFTGVSDSADTYLPALIAGATDINGNGYVDPGELPTDDNRAASEITSFGGIIDSATLDGIDCDLALPGVQPCIYVSGTMPVDIGLAQTDCDIGGDIVPVCVPSIVYPQAMLGTSVNMDAVATMGNPPFMIIMNDLPTGPILMRVRDNPAGPAAGPIVGYLVPGMDGPRFRATLDLYMDAPDLPLSNFNLEHDLRSKEATVAVEGPVSFTDDGRIRIDASNVQDIVLQVNLRHTTLPNTNGFVTMVIPTGAMKLQLTNRLPQASLVREALQAP